ncbi:hypothetical protein B0H14DRAFT_3169423 [Mycena olivaceomarginata]|nr:hypothetical protein B0H14DRAFT_3169423 [Mycena olivaceomarginata]
MPGSALGPSKDPARLFSIHLEEQIALLGTPQPAKEQISTSKTRIEEECQLAATDSIPEDAFPELKMAYPLLRLAFLLTLLEMRFISPIVATVSAILAWRATSTPKQSTTAFCTRTGIGPRRSLTLTSARRRLPTSSFTITDRLFGTAVQLAKNLGNDVGERHQISSTSSTPPSPSCRRRVPYPAPAAPATTRAAAAVAHPEFPLCGTVDPFPSPVRLAGAAPFPFALRTSLPFAFPFTSPSIHR